LPVTAVINNLGHLWMYTSELPIAARTRTVDQGKQHPSAHTALLPSNPFPGTEHSHPFQKKRAV